MLGAIQKSAEKHGKNFLLVVLASVFPTLLIWLPFFLRIPEFWGIKLPRDGMATIIANFDGPYYIVAAKTLYNPEAIAKFPFALTAEYYAAHFPGFPLLIRAASPFGYPWGMMIITLASSIAALWFFYLLLGQIGFGKNALWMTLVFAIFPARWLIVRSIGSPEPLFLAAILASFYFFSRGNYWIAGLAGAAAQVTKSPGILLFFALVLAITHPKVQDLLIYPLRTLKTLLPLITPLGLIPLSALLVFIFYGRAYNDFFAYFHSGDNTHLLFPPFQVFNAQETWVGTFWLEEIIWIYLFGFLGISQLIKKRMYPFAWFVGIFFTSTLFVSHRDIARYILPITPFLLVAFSDIINHKHFKWALAFLALPIYLFSINFIIGNVTPILDWTLLL